MNVDFKNLKEKNNFLKYLTKNSIMCQFHYIPINKFSILRKYKIKLPLSEVYYRTTLSIPIFHQLSKKQLKKIVFKIKKYFN